MAGGGAAQRAGKPRVAGLPGQAEAASGKGLRQSFGMMVNYLYDPDHIEANLEDFATEGRIAASSAVRRLARR